MKARPIKIRSRVAAGCGRIWLVETRQYGRWVFFSFEDAIKETDRLIRSRRRETE